MKLLATFEEVFGWPGVAKTWGLDSHQGWVVTCVSLHPDKMIEYPMASNDRIHILFTPPPVSTIDPSVRKARRLPPFIAEVPGPAGLAKIRRRLLMQILSLPRFDNAQSNHLLDAKILFSICCCAITYHWEDVELMGLVSSALIWIRDEFSLDLSRELFFANGGAAGQLEAGSLASLQPRDEETMDSSVAASAIFERCSICSGGFTWIGDPEEAWCVNGHPSGKL